MKKIPKILMAAITWLVALPALFRDALSGEPVIHAANIAEGRHAESVTKLTDAAITTRHLLYKVGSDVDHIAVAGATDTPLGVVADEATAAEEYVSVDLLGKGCTKRMVASEAVSAGARVFAAASGKIATSGSVLVGIALTAATTDGDIIEVEDICIGSDGIVYDAVAVAGATLAIPITHRTVQKTTGGAEALTLADGAFIGQKLHITLVVDGGDGTLTPTTPSGFATIVFADAGDTVDLEWTADGWIISGMAGVAAPPVITL